MEKLNLKDRKILYELDLDARQSDSEIAKRVGLTRDTVEYRINKLVERGYVKSFITILNPMKLGFDWYRTLVKFQGLSLEKESEIINWLMPRVSYITRAEGQWDLSMSMFAKNVYEYRNFVNEFLMKYSNYIEEYDVAVITRLWHYHRNYLVGIRDKSTRIEMLGFDENQKVERIEIDEIDYRILSAIITDARAKTTDIARKSKVTEMIVRYRIKKLIDNGVILGFRPLLNAKKLGYTYFKVHFALHNLTPEKKKKMLAYIRQYNNMIYSMELVGGSDLETHIEVEDNEGLYQYLSDVRRNFADIIRNYYFMEYKGELKWEYLPKMSFR